LLQLANCSMFVPRQWGTLTAQLPTVDSHVCGTSNVCITPPKLPKTAFYKTSQPIAHNCEDGFAYETGSYISRRVDNDNRLTDLNFTDDDIVLLDDEANNLQKLTDIAAYIGTRTKFGLVIKTKKTK